MPHKFSDLIENHRMMALLMARVYHENHVQTGNELKSKIFISIGNLAKGQEIVRILVKENEDLKVKLTKVVLEA